MPRDLGDVLHYFLPEAEASGLPGEASECAERLEAPANRGGFGGQAQPLPAPLADARAESLPAALPLVAIPLGAHDVVRAAFAWNLAVELSRLGGRVSLVAPQEYEGASLWPAHPEGPLGTELAIVPARDLTELYRAALDVAVRRAANAFDGGAVLVCIPPAWLRSADAARALFRWSLLLTSSESNDLLEAYGFAKLLSTHNPDGQLGVTVHGARAVGEAREAFERLADVAWKRLGCPLTSYGLLVDDLHVYRAIVAQRPIGLAHPQSPAARALRDVAGMVLARAQEIARA